jgi:site-specific DNA recombinase
VDLTSRKLIVNEQEADAVRLIFRRYNEGWGYGRIADELYAKGCRTKRNGHAYKDESEWIITSDAIPAIISRTEFEKAQARLKANVRRKAQTTAKAVYLLSGKIICGECGNAFVGSKRTNGSNPRRDYITYRCGKRDRKGKCHNKEMRRELLEAFVLDKLASYAFDENMVPRLLAERENYYRERNSEAAAEINGITNRLKDTEKEIGNIVKVIGQTASPALIGRLEELERDKTLLEAELARARSSTDVPEIDAEALKEALRKAKTMLLSGSLPNIKKVIDNYVDSVIIHKDKVELIFKFHPDLTPPRDDKSRGAANLYADSGKSKKHTQLTQFMDNSCVLCGGEQRRYITIYQKTLKQSGLSKDIYSPALTA